MQNLLSNNVSWALSKHVVLLITIMCDYMGSRELQRDLLGPIKPCLWHAENLIPAPPHVLLLPVFLPVTLHTSAGQTGISPAGEGGDGHEHFTQPVPK